MAKAKLNGSLIARLEVEEKATLSVSVDKCVLDMLEDYSKFLDSPRGYVVQQALAYVMANDGPFQAHRKS